jgi:hypothetical protein
MTDMTLPIPATKRDLLRMALGLDAVVTGINGAVYLAAAGPVGDLLGLEPTLLRGLGAFLLAFAAFVAVTATRPAQSAVLAIVAGNVIWAADSIVAAIAGWGSPSTAGTVWIVLQAIVVAAFAELQLIGLRRR